MMIRYHLTIRIFNDFFEKKLDSRWKISSVWFDDYDYIVEKIFHDMSVSEINEFKLKLFNAFRDQLDWCRVVKYDNWEIYDWYMIPWYTFDVPSSLIALCIPRKVRDKYFDYDWLRERYHIKSEFIYHLK